MRRALAIVADLASSFIGIGLIRHSDTLPSWADATCTVVGVIFLWFCLMRWPWEPKPTEGAA